MEVGRGEGGGLLLGVSARFESAINTRRAFVAILPSFLFLLHFLHSSPFWHFFSPGFPPPGGWVARVAGWLGGWVVPGGSSGC